MAAASGAVTEGNAAWPGDAQRWWILGASCLLAVALGTSPSVAALLTPTTPDVFGITALTVQLTVNVAQLVVVAFVLFGGALGDLFGRRRFLLIGAAGFVLTGIFTAASPNQATFVVGRVLMGLFSALLLPLAVSVLRIAFPQQELARPLGIYTAVSGLAQLGGPLLTQLFHNALTWRVAFVLPVLCGVAGGELARRYIPESSAEGGRRRVEAVTTAAWASVVLAVMFAISAPTAGRYAARYLLVGLALALVATLVLIVSSVQTRGNVLGRSIPNKRALAVAIVAGVVLSLAVGGVLLQLTNYLTTIERFGPVRMILTISPFGPGILVGGLLAGRLTGPLGARNLISAGLALMGLALVGIAFISPTLSYWWLILPFFLFGLGFNMANTCVLDTILSLVAYDLAGAAAGVNEAVGRIGGAIGPLFTGTLLIQFGGLLYLNRLQAAGLTPAQIAQARDALNMTLRNTTPPNVPPEVLQRLVASYQAAYTTGLHATILLVAAVCLVGAAFVWLVMPKRVAAPKN
jgi:MFS transporter, DHA2 family, methylenomycin A resistance protein